MSIRAWLAATRLVSRGLREEDLSPDPFAQFREWFDFAQRLGLPMPNAMTLSTVSAEGQPTARTVLLKGHGPDGFVFYTNYDSRKGREIAANPRVCLLLHWHVIQRQIRIDGVAEKTDAATSDRYFQSRLRGSRLSAWASRQSEPVLGGSAEMHAAHDEVEKRFGNGPIPCPPFWGGYRVVPARIEFWQGRAFRFHDRFIYERDGGGVWTWRRYYP